MLKRFQGESWAESQERLKCKEEPVAFNKEEAPEKSVLFIVGSFCGYSIF
jgi:hypothetical protein